MLIDAGGSVSRAYGVLEWAVASDEPGHTSSWSTKTA
jgi:hypothetical protein